MCRFLALCQGLPWSLIRSPGQQHYSGVDTPLQRRGAKLDLHFWVLEYLSRAASGDVVGRATGVARRCAHAVQTSVPYDTSSWGAVATGASNAAVVGEDETDLTLIRGNVSASRIPFVEWTWRDRQRDTESTKDSVRCKFIG